MHEIPAQGLLSGNCLTSLNRDFLIFFFGCHKFQCLAARTTYFHSRLRSPGTNIAQVLSIFRHKCVSCESIIFFRFVFGRCGLC